MTHAETESTNTTNYKTIMNTKNKTILYIAIAGIISLSATAQTFTPAGAVQDEPIQSQQIMSSGTNYYGTVYEPFSSTTPSEQSNVGASSQETPRPSSGPRRSLIGGPESGQGPSPIGDALIPLLVMALGFAGYTALRKKRNRASATAGKPL